MLGSSTRRWIASIAVIFIIASKSEECADILRTGGNRHGNPFAGGIELRPRLAVHLHAREVLAVRMAQPEPDFLPAKRIRQPDCGIHTPVVRVRFDPEGDWAEECGRTFHLDYLIRGEPAARRAGGQI